MSYSKDHCSKSPFRVDGTPEENAAAVKNASGSNLKAAGFSYDASSGNYGGGNYDQLIALNAGESYTSTSAPTDLNTPKKNQPRGSSQKGISGGTGGDGGKKTPKQFFQSLFSSKDNTRQVPNKL